MHCPGCGESLDAAQTFCRKCGQALRCGNCRAPQSSSPRFCHACGKDVGRDEPRQPYETSWVWWLWVIFAGWIGGLMAWLLLRS